MKNEITFENIQTNCLSVLEQELTRSRVSVNFFSFGTIKLTGFAVVQFVEGALLLMENEIKFPVSLEEEVIELRLYSVLSKKMIEGLTHSTDKTEWTFVVERKQLLILKKWLTARMTHCEMERDNRSPRFNPDTYIAQKILLLNLRELLMGEIEE